MLGLDLNSPAQILDPFTDIKQAKAPGSFAFRLCDLKTDSIVFDNDPESVAIPPQHDLGVTGIGMFHHIYEQFAGRLEEHYAEILMHRLWLPVIVETSLESMFLLEFARQPFQRRDQS